MHKVEQVALGKGPWYSFPTAAGWKVIFRVKEGGFHCVCSSGQHTEASPGHYANGRTLFEHLKGTAKGKAGGEYIGPSVYIPYSVRA